MADKEECPVIDIANMVRELEVMPRGEAYEGSLDVPRNVRFLSCSHEVNVTSDPRYLSEGEVRIHWFEYDTWVGLQEFLGYDQSTMVKKIREFVNDRDAGRTEGIGCLTLDYEAAESLALVLLEQAHKARLKLREGLRVQEAEREKRLEKFLKDKGLLRDFE